MYYGKSKSFGLLNMIQVLFLFLIIKETESRFTQHGLPYYPIGEFVYNYDETSNQKLIDMESSFGSNLVCPYWDTNPLDWNIRYMDRCFEIDVGVHFSMYIVSGLPPSPEKTKNITEMINAVKNHPSLFAYYISDEVDCGKSDPPFCIPPENMEDTYKIIKSLDKIHPISILVNNPNAMKYYVNASDFSISDPYPCGNLSDAVSPITTVSSQAETLSALGQPFMITPMAFGGDDGGCERTPTPQEERVMSYLAVIHGAKGLQYFARGFRYPVSEISWDECRRVALEMQELTPALVDGTQFNIFNIPKTVECSGWEYEYNMGKYIIVMCANIVNSPTSLLIKMDELDNSDTITSIFDNRILQKHSFDTIYDMIPGYGTVVYRILKSVNHTQEKTRMIDFMNYVANPSFENTYNVGIPNGVSIVWENNYGSSIKIDSRTSVHEFHSLRNIIADDYAHVIYSLCNPETPQDLCDFKLYSNTTYEISFWGKSIKNYKTNIYPSISIIFEGTTPNISEEHILTDDWKRYSFIGSGNNGPIGYNISKGITWIDLVQVVPM
jgi:hypothetical protein